jgi:putative phosphoribosyl transferase
MAALHQATEIPAGQVSLGAEIVVPEPANGVVAFAHGSGSSRHSARNQYVAAALQSAGLATVLVDLLTSDEEGLDVRTGELRFDIALLASRVLSVADWLVEHPPTAGLGVGLFGASTGAAAALVAAASRPISVQAVVSRGGRPDLAGDALRKVHQPTLLIVGGNDNVVIDLNRQALRDLPTETRLEVVPGATHLFPEPGTLQQVAQLATGWFVRHLRRMPPGHDFVDDIVTGR